MLKHELQLYYKAMFYWSPLETSVQEWTPVGGWNKTWVEKEKIQCTQLYFFLIKKGYSVCVASSIAQMIIYKEKYHVSYSEEQEREIKKALSPIHLVKA
jgi:CRISPR/Cas system-associated exonuclease Cas4 (RecB family)